MSEARSFESRVEFLETAGTAGMHALPVPNEAVEGFPEDHHRIILRVNQVEVRRGLQARRTGQPYLVIGKATLKELGGLKLGDSVVAEIWPDPEPDRIDLADELLEALAQDDEARERWDTFTPGKQRSLNHYVDSAKRMETRVKRAVELADKIRTRTLYGDEG